MNTLLERLIVVASTGNWSEPLKTAISGLKPKEVQEVMREAGQELSFLPNPKAKEVIHARFRIRSIYLRRIIGYCRRRLSGDCNANIDTSLN